MDVGTLVEVTIDGLGRGLLLSLLGAAITLVFGLGSLLNLALGAFAVVAVLVTVTALPLVPHPLVASGVGLGAVAVLGVAVDRTLLSSVYRSDGEERILLGIFITLGLALLIDGILYVYFPLRYSVPHGIASVRVGGLLVRGTTVLTIAVASVVLVALFAFLNRTFLGKATRTVFQDETGAVLCGIEPRRIRTLIFVLSVLLAGIAGILWSASSEVSVDTAFQLTIFAIVVSIVGGVRNIRGTVGAGVLLGLVITYGNFFVGAYVSMIVLFGVAVAVLIARPGEVTA